MQNTVASNQTSLNMNPNSFFRIIIAVELLTPLFFLTPFQLQIKCILSIILILMYKLYVPIVWNLMYNLTTCMSPNTSETNFMALIQ